MVRLGDNEINLEVPAYSTALDAELLLITVLQQFLFRNRTKDRADKNIRLALEWLKALDSPFDETLFRQPL